MYLIRFCDVLEIDLEKAIEEKLTQNKNKYPVELSKGSAKKYDQLEQLVRFQLCSTRMAFLMRVEG